MKEKQMTKEELAALKARLLAETRERMAKAEARPGFAEEYAAWKREYDATVAMYKARKKANLTQEELAKRMKTPRAQVSRIENGQNVTFATFARYLRGCGFDFSLRIFPIGRKREGITAAAMTMA
jgi:ribosome-binding protein aMBF1 (putative translation factor)